MDGLLALYANGGGGWITAGLPASLRVGAVGVPPASCRRLVLVEGNSDLAALEVLLEGRGVAWTTAGLAVLAMGGVTNVGHVLDLVERDLGGPDPSLAIDVIIMCDAQEVGVVTDRTDRPLVICDSDLEDELIRALGVDVVLGVIEAMGESRSLNALRRQPQKRDAPIEEVLHRFMGVRSGRKVRAARLLAMRADADGVLPPPLRDVLAFAVDGRPPGCEAGR